MNFRRLMLSVLFLSIAMPHGDACTVMRLEFNGKPMIARNHDWMFSRGMVVVSKRGIPREGMAAVRPAQWESVYGSVAFVQFGLDLPFAGINEKGLTVDLLELTDTQYAPTSSHSAQCVNAVQWVQYQLDTASTVEEVVKSLSAVQPTPVIEALEKVHYFITDAQGDVAVIEFLDGKPIVHHSIELMNCALANTVWDRSRNLALDSPNNRRYERAVEAVRKNRQAKSNSSPVDIAFHSLQKVAQPRTTRWSLVYEPTERKVTWTSDQHPERRWIDLDDLDFTPSPNQPVDYLDVNAPLEGNVASKLKRFDLKAHRQMVRAAFSNMRITGFARSMVENLVETHARKSAAAEVESRPEANR